MPTDPVAGFRLVRRLGSGSRADVFLGHAGPDSLELSPPRTAAIKVFHAATSAESIDAEVHALSVASHAHVVQLRDLSTGDGARPVLVLERLELGSLGQLLAARSSLAAGEAVTILAPLAAAVEAIHESGIVHGGISPARVLFRESGAPVLSGFGRATRGVEGIEDDNRALALLAGAVLDRVPEASSLRGWLATLVGHPRGFSDRLSERLFDLAEASPVRFVRETNDAEPVPMRTSVGEPVPASEVEPAETRLERARRLIEPYLTRVPPRFRKPRYAALAAGMLTVLIAIVAAPGAGPVETVSAERAPSAVPLDDSPVGGDDPIAAFAVLLDARNGCIRDLSLLCLDAVLQQGSAAMDADIALIRSIEKGGGGEAELRASSPTLVERMGDAALIGYTTDSEPASALLVKGEAGWRIRSYVAG